MVGDMHWGYENTDALLASILAVAYIAAVSYYLALKSPSEKRCGI
jgi:hypothetical protein